MWRYVPWFIIIGMMACVLVGWCFYYWRSRRDEIENQEFERARMEHEEKMRRDSDEP